MEFGEFPWHDLEVLCDRKKKVRTSKSILAIVSPFFRALLYGDFKEKGVDHIELPNVNGEEFLELLRYLYPNCRKPITGRLAFVTGNSKLLSSATYSNRPVIKQCCLCSADLRKHDRCLTVVLCTLLFLKAKKDFHFCLLENNVETLLFMADRFLMENVTDDCEKFLLFCKEEQVSLEDKTLLADLYRLPRLKQQSALDFAAKLDKCSLKDEK